MKLYDKVFLRIVNECVTYSAFRKVAIPRFRAEGLGGASLFIIPPPRQVFSDTWHITTIGTKMLTLRRFVEFPDIIGIEWYNETLTVVYKDKWQ